MADLTGRGRHGNPERVLARERRALTLRVVNRLSYAEIARRLLPCDLHMPNGVDDCPLCERLYQTPTGARRAVKRALDRDYPPPSGEAREDYIRQDQALIDTVIRRAAADAIDPGLDPKDRHRAMGRLAMFLQRRARLLGLDAPTQVHVTAELDEAIEAAIALLQAGPGLPELEGTILDDDG